MRALERADRSIPVIVDPVMIATSGDRLLKEDAVDLYKTQLFPRATLITPNLAEAGVLLDRQIATRPSDGRCGLRISRKNLKPLFCSKAAISPATKRSTSVFTMGQPGRFSAPFVKGVKTHGTGCTYSAAIAAGLALGTTTRTSHRARERIMSARPSRIISRGAKFTRSIIRQAATLFCSGGL